MATIAATGDSASAARMATEKFVAYTLRPGTLQRDVARFRRLVTHLKTAVRAVWGEGEVKTPQPKEYVKYTQNYRSRASVDFDMGLITVETLDHKEPIERLRNAIVTTLLTPRDPRAVDLFSAKPVKLGGEPFLYGEVTDHKGKNIRWSWRAGRFADYLIQTHLKTRVFKANEGFKTVHYVDIFMTSDHLQVRAEKFKRFVERYAKHFSVSKNLVFAIMKTESNFNPYAVSSAPAYGLMQVVPATAGRDVYRFLNKRDGLPSRAYLLDAGNNIKYGSAYLHLLTYEYLKEIQNPVSRDYCVIAAYNTGLSHVLTAFHPDPSQAYLKINRLTPSQVYHALHTRLPTGESRRYLVKVLEAQKEFVRL